MMTQIFNYCTQYSNKHSTLFKVFQHLFFFRQISFSLNSYDLYTLSFDFTESLVGGWRFCEFRRGSFMVIFWLVILHFKNSYLIISCWMVLQYFFLDIWIFMRSKQWPMLIDSTVFKFTVIFKF